MTDAKYKSLIDECLKEECDCSHWCLLKEVIVSSKKFDQRFLIQAKTIEIFKWHLGRVYGKDVGWQSAWSLWAEEGYAASFAIVYNEFPDCNPQELYKKVIAHLGKKPDATIK